MELWRALIKPAGAIEIELLSVCALNIIEYSFRSQLYDILIPLLPCSVSHDADQAVFLKSVIEGLDSSADCKEIFLVWWVCSKPWTLSIAESRSWIGSCLDPHPQLIQNCDFLARNLALGFREVWLFWEHSTFVSPSCGTYLCFLPSCQHILLRYLHFPSLQSIKIMASPDLTLGWVIPKRDGCRASQNLQNHPGTGLMVHCICLLTRRVFVSFFILF